MHSKVQPAENTSGPVAASPPSPRFKLAISLIVILHLMAVVVEPMLFFTRSRRGASEAVQPVRNIIRPYTEFGYLNHGYFFFAPEPGPSHLMQCNLTYPDGDQAELRFPDKTAQWPRLLYHRHFMLAEFLHLLHLPPPDPGLAAVDPVLFGNWQRDRNRFEMIRDSMQAHVLARYGAQSVTIERIEHQLPSSADVLERQRPLDDPPLYIVLPDDLEEPAGELGPPALAAPLVQPPFLGAPTGEEVKP